jgi:hypothetical protein
VEKKKTLILHHINLKRLNKQDEISIYAIPRTGVISGNLHLLPHLAHLAPKSTVEVARHPSNAPTRWLVLCIYDES